MNDIFKEFEYVISKMKEIGYEFDPSNSNRYFLNFYQPIGDEDCIAINYCYNEEYDETCENMIDECVGMFCDSSIKGICVMLKVEAMEVCLDVMKYLEKHYKEIKQNGYN